MVAVGSGVFVGAGVFVGMVVDVGVEGAKTGELQLVKQTEKSTARWRKYFVFMHFYFLTILKMAANGRFYRQMQFWRKKPIV